MKFIFSAIALVIGSTAFGAAPSGGLVCRGNDSFNEQALKEFVENPALVWSMVAYRVFSWNAGVLTVRSNLGSFTPICVDGKTEAQAICVPFGPVARILYNTPNVAKGTAFIQVWNKEFSPYNFIVLNCNEF